MLGPLLTLVVFKAGKPGLKFDMGCIVTAQLLCLSAGIWVVYQERPLALVYAFDSFYSVAADEFEENSRDPSVLDNIPGAHPKLVLVELPQDMEQRAMLVMRSQFGGDPLFMQTERFVPFPQDAAAVMQRQETLREEAVNRLGIARSETAGPNCEFAKFVSAHNEGYVCFDPTRRKLNRFFSSLR